MAGPAYSEGNGAPGAVLSQRALNRALLARQLLLRRWQMPAIEAIEHLIGLQSQAPNPPYIGLWTRLAGFRHEDLSRLITERRAVRIALMRSTIHLVSADDCLALRPLMRPILDRGLQAAYGPRLTGVDLAALAVSGRALVEEEPRTFNALGALLGRDWPDHDPAALAQAVRTLVPLVQVPPRGLWGASGQAAHSSAEAWLARPLIPDFTADDLILRYLAAFGPATVQDVQTWSGLTGLRATAEHLRPRLVSFRDDRGRELFDLPDAPRPAPNTPAPVRFLPEFDNLLLSHADRTRIIADEDRTLVFTINGIIRATILVDGFVRGTWKVERQRDTATLLIQPFRPLTTVDQAALAEEGARLLTFVAGDAQEHDIRFG